jgi:hypothetical protein
MSVCYTHGGAAPQVRQAAALRLATLVSPAVARLEQLMKQNENLSVALSAIKEVLERNGLDAFGKPEPPSKFVPTAPPPTTTFNVSQVKFSELSDEGLDLVDRVIKGLLDAHQPKVIDVPKEPGK